MCRQREMAASIWPGVAILLGHGNYFWQSPDYLPIAAVVDSGTPYYVGATMATIAKQAGKISQKHMLSRHCSPGFLASNPRRNAVRG